LIKPRSITPVIIFLLFTAAIAGMIWGIFHQVEGNPFSAGFYIQWLGIRSLIADGTSPYSEATTEKIQGADLSEFYYAPWVSAKYTSPLFSGVVIFPFALIVDETIAHSLWSFFQLLAIFAVILLGLKITGWKSSWYIFFFFLLFSLFSYHVSVPWIDGGLSIWSALFLVLSVHLLQNDRIEASGIFLALSLIQPIMVILPVIFALVWAVSQKRRLLVLWFFMTLGILSIIGLFLVPDWIMQYLRLLYNFNSNFPPGNLAALFSGIWPGLGKQLGWILSGICIVILILEWWLALRRDYRWFLWTVCFTLVICQWVGIPTAPVNLFGMIFALIFISAMLSERWPRGGPWVAVFLSFLLFIWEWSLFFGNSFSNHPELQNNLIIPLPFVLLVGLYWVRWWALKPRGLLLDALKFGETK
jgi:hypothetical protein